MRNVLSQKFRRHQVTERNETTIVKKSDSSSNTGGESSGPKEFSRRSSMRDEINVEQCYSESSNAPRILHATQSLNDARTTPQSSMSAKYSREYPSILREQNLTKEKKSYRHSIMIPIERTNKESTEQSENFLRRQQQKLYKLRGESLRKFGQTNTPQGLDEQQRRARQHASLPPMGRQNQYPQENIPHQLPFELIIDRYPPQLVRSIDKTKQLDIWTVSDSGIYHKRHEFPQESSFGFSPFPVHGPFMAEELMLEQESKIIQRQESKVSGCYDSANQYYSGNVNGQTVGMSSSNIMSSSDELWHSAYECFPQQKKFTPQPQLQQPKIPQIQDEQKQQNNKIQTMSILAEENGSECNIQKNFHLKNILVNNLNVSGCFSERIVLFVKIPKIMASNILGPQIETSTLSEQQANEEVRLLMYKGTKPKTKLMSKSVESTGTLEGEENRRESERVIYPVRVEISGPVHFLHATNMNVMNSSDNPTDYSIHTSMTSSGGMKEFRQGTFETNFSKNRQKSPSPTKWTQTEYQPKINYNLNPEELNTVKTQFEDKRQSQVISPPVERFIESVCDIQPILAEISEAMCHQALPCEKKYEESYLRKENKNVGGPPPIPPKKHLIKRQQKYIYKIEEKNKKNLKEYFNSEEINNQQNPYLIQSTSHCHLARVTEITQEWLVKCNNKLKNNNKYGMNEDNEGVDFCNIIIKPLYGQEFDKAEFWTMAWKENIQEKSKKVKDERIFDNTIERIYLRDDGINKKEGNFNNYRGKFSTLQTSNRQFRQPGFQEKIYKTRSFNNDELPRLIEQTQYEELRRALLEVQRDLDSAQEYKKNNAEVQRIENVILSISERIKLPNEPVTKAQAEAKEELLRVRLARMILNLNPDFEPKQNFKENIKKDNVDLSNENVFADIALEGYYVRALREPIGLLREKLALLEHRLLSEQQLEINDQLLRIDLTPPPLQNLEQKRRKESLSQRSDEISRMTPLIVMLRHKLNALDDLCHKEQLKANTTNISGRLTPYEERKTVFDLLVRINEEIDTIHKLCREENVKERIEIVLKVLKKVSSSIDKIMETLKNMSTATTVATSRQPSISSLSETKQNILNVDRPIIYQQQIDHPSSSKLEQAILNKQQQKEKNINILSQTKQTFLQRMKAKQNEKKTEQFFDFPLNGSNKQQNIESKHSKIYKHDNIVFKNVDNEKIKQSSRKKTPPQVLPKPKSLTSSIEERIGPLYSIIEEDPSTSKQTNISKQRVNAVELSAHLDRPYESTSRVNAFIPLLTTRTAKRIESPPLSPASTSNQHLLEISKNLSSDLPHSSKKFKDQSPFRLGPCPISYLAREQQKITNGQKPSQLNSSIDDDDVEEAVSVSIASSAVDNSSCLSVPILFRRNSALSSVPSASTYQQETAIIDEEIESEENCTETFFLRRRNKHSILNAVIYPEQHASVKATFCGNNFQVDVERMSECGRDSVVMVSEEFCEKKVLIRSGSPLLKSTIMEEIERENSDSPGYTDAHTRMAVSINAKSDYDSVHVFLEEIPWGQIGLEVKESPLPLNNKRNNNKAITNISPDDNRSGLSFGMSTSIESSLSRESVLKQISVSESNHFRGNNGGNGNLSLCSASKRSSQKSLAHSTGSGTTTILVGGQEEDLDDIPAYVIKIGSTASITCELNSDCISNLSNIEWIRGQNEQIIFTENGKFECHFHDFINVLVIYNVSHEDGQLYSIKINGEIYPVAYLIIEENNEEEEEEIGDDFESPHQQNRNSFIINEEIFLTSPQTQFVMQGETAFISASMNRANLDVYWHKDGQILDKSNGDNRILFESTTNGWYRIIVQNVQFSDQGFYFAQIGDKFTSVQLIVEDRIDEKEVQVSSAETDDEDLGDYLVPIGSTATIACELENVSFGYRLHWQRNHKDLDSRIVSDEGKFEHVVNGTKHYLIIHCAQPFDSGVYSVRIGDSKFKVAQITISNEQKLSNCSSSGSRIKRISSQSLNK